MPEPDVAPANLVLDDRHDTDAPMVVAPEPADTLTVDPETSPVVFRIANLDVYYGDHRAVRDVSLDVRKRQITALIGPSGCGKTTVLRCLNRMNDLVKGARVEGTIEYHGVDLYGDGVDVT